MTAKFAEAFRLLWRHLGLFTAIILTVWLPGNILLNYVAYYLNGAADTNTAAVVRASMWVEAIFGPLYIAALVYALFQIKHGRSVSYREAMTVGFRKWGSLFVARLVAGIFIGLGLLALIVPGLVLAVRYSLLDGVVVLEDGKVTSNARARSTALTSGKRWQIFGAAILFFPVFAVVSFLVYLPLSFVEPMNFLPVEVVLDCLLDMFYAVIQIVIFLFYWEATADERRAERNDPPNGGPAVAPANPAVTDGSPSVS